MNDVAKDFDPALCFVGPNSLLSNLETPVKYASNEDFSRLLLHMSVILRYPTDYIAVDRKYWPLLQTVFSSPLLATESVVDSVVIEEVNAREEVQYKQGEIIMPVFVPADSTKVYNVRREDALSAGYTQDVIIGALNFFNYVVRDNKVGITRIVWRDPVTNDTILREENYDEMFALHIADGYLKTIDPEYPYERPLYNLSMCTRTVEVLKELTAYGVSFRAMAPELTRAILVPWQPLGSIQSAPDPRIAVDADEVNKELFSLLYFAFIARLNRRSVFTLVVTGFKKYAHLAPFSDTFPNCRIDVWGELPPSIVSSKIISRGKALTATALIKQYPPKSSSYLVSAHTPATSDRLVEKFMRPWMSTNDGSARYKPNTSFAPCFSSARETRECSIFPNDKAKATSIEIANHKASIIATIEVLNREMRDLKKWQYFIAGNEGLKMSYDKAVLHVLLESLA